MCRKRKDRIEPSTSADVEKGKMTRKVSEISNNNAKCTQWLQKVHSMLEDWLFLATLGCLMAIVSLVMDLAIEYLQKSHLLVDAIFQYRAQYDAVNELYNFAIWTSFPIVFVTLSAFFVRTVAPQAIGSGIPEMKTILRGVVLKEYLTLRTLISKMIGLILSLGSGMPIGKEGPQVHIASVVANLLAHCMPSFHTPPFDNESRSYEMLAAACAVGVSSTFSAPVGGVLFSIEVTSVYFAIRNYWRGFFAATCSATLLRVLRMLLIETEVTVLAFYQTYFPKDAFFVEELPFFAMIGILCGLLSAAFICLQRRMVLFLRHNRLAKLVFQKHWAIYPMLVAFIVGSLTYPNGFGQFIGGEKRFGQAAKDFFDRCTWYAPRNSSLTCPPDLLLSWSAIAEGNHLAALLCFTFTYFFLTVLASTVAIPSGIFGPSFVIGASIGRFFGELLAILYPNGIKGPAYSPIYPGVYAVVGSAAFTGGVTHTVSVAVIVFELTGQLLYILPVMIAVLCSNAVCSYLQPSIYDSAIKIKRLPYLPDIPPQHSSRFHEIRAAQFMTRDVHLFSNSTNFGQLHVILGRYPHLKAFPLVEDEEARILIGSCSRSRLQRAFQTHLGAQARKHEAQKRKERLRYHLDSQNMPRNRNGTTMAEIGVEDEEGTSATNTNRTAAGDIWKSSFMFPTSAAGEAIKQTSAENVIEDPFAKDVEKGGCDPPMPVNLKRSQTIPASLGFDPSNGPFDVHTALGGMIRMLGRWSARLRNASETPLEGDLYGLEREQWEKSQLEGKVNFDAIGIDPAPFQLVKHTSLIKVHALFSLLGLSRAYVTNCGRLVGVVSLRDLRTAIERVNAGQIIAAEIETPISKSPFKLEDDEVNKLSSSEDENDELDILNPCLEVIEAERASINGATIHQHQQQVAGVHATIRKASEVFKGEIDGCE